MWAFHLLANVSNHGLRLDKLTNCLAEFGDTYIALYRLKHSRKRWSLEELERQVDVDSGSRTL